MLLPDPDPTQPNFSLELRIRPFKKIYPEIRTVSIRGSGSNPAIVSPSDADPDPPLMQIPWYFPELKLYCTRICIFIQFTKQTFELCIAYKVPTKNVLLSIILKLFSLSTGTIIRVVFLGIFWENI